MSDGGWAACLDRFEAHLLGQFQALADGAPDSIVAFARPNGLGPLPGHLVDRARQLADEAQRLQQELSESAAAVARQLQLLAAVPGQRAGTRTASYVDSRA